MRKNHRIASKGQGNTERALGLIDLSPGARLVLGEKTVEVDGPSSVDVVSVRDLATGQLLRADISELRAPTALSPPPDVQAVDPQQWARAVTTAHVIRPLLDRGRIPSAELKSAAIACQVSERTIRRKLARYRSSLLVTGLLPSTRGRISGSRLLDEGVEKIVREKIESVYLTKQRVPISYLCEHIAAACRENALQTPSRSTVERRLQAMAPFEIDRCRHGYRVAAQTHQLRPSGLIVSRPLELVEIDHTLCDVFVVSDDEHRLPLGRPWITLAIDVYSRVVTGFYLALHAPSAVSVALCLQHSVMPKKEWLVGQGIEAEWPVHGLPSRILVDNGKDFRSRAFQLGCDEYGISLEHRPVRTPHFGAHVERLIGTAMQRMHLLPGTTFSRSGQRGEYASEKRAVMTLRELRRWLGVQITKWYHVRTHSGVQASPVDRWREGFGRGKDDVATPPLVADPRKLLLDFLPEETRSIGRKGISFSCATYWNDELEALVKRGSRIAFRYDPRDASAIHVKCQNGLWVTATCTSERRRFCTLSEQQLVDNHRRRASKNKENLELLDDGLRESVAIVASAYLKTRESRTTANQQGREGPGGCPRSLSDEGTRLDDYMELLPEDVPAVEEWGTSQIEHGNGF